MELTELQIALLERYNNKSIGMNLENLAKENDIYIEELEDNINHLISIDFLEEKDIYSKSIGSQETPSRTIICISSFGKYYLDYLKRRN